MARMKRGAMVASILLLTAFVISACNQPYSQPPAATNTPIDTSSLFATALTEPDSMKDVENFSTQTAQAALTPNLIDTTTTPAAGDTTQAAVTQTPTPLVALNPTATATLASSGSSSSSGATPTTAPVGSTYILKSGEFPYCIARRYNVDPDELLRLSGLSAGVLYPAGTVLRIPQSGNPFPDGRMLKNHPTTYTVASSDETVYGVACLFGDIEPSAIASANNISVDANLTAGQSLNIP